MVTTLVLVGNVVMVVVITVVTAATAASTVVLSGGFDESLCAANAASTDASVPLATPPTIAPITIAINKMIMTIPIVRR